MIEQWKSIDGYEGLYEVSNLGNVKSLGNNANRKDKFLKPATVKGYQQVGLWKDGKRKKFLVHRLVAQAFLEKPFDPNATDINHKDENPLNNRVENLEWCTRAYNNNYGTRNERAAKAKRGVYNTKNSKPVYQYSISGEFIREWVSSAEVERTLGIAQQSVNQCCRGVRKSSRGYKWAYK